MESSDLVEFIFKEWLKLVVLTLILNGLHLQMSFITIELCCANVCPTVCKRLSKTEINFALKVEMAILCT